MYYFSDEQTVECNLTRVHTCEAKVKLERLALTGVFGEEQLALNNSSL